MRHFRFRSYNYLYYEQGELLGFLNSVSNGYYRLSKVFSGFFIFEKTGERYTYSVIDKSTAASDRVQKYIEADKNIAYLDRYLSVYIKEEQTCASDFPPETKFLRSRRFIIWYNLVTLLCVVMFSMINFFALINIRNSDIKYSCLMFGTSLLFYVNYMIFYIGELYDYIVWRKKSCVSKVYKRSKLKNRMFHVGNIFETLLGLYSIVLCVWLLWAGHIFIGVFFVFLYLMEILLRYNYKAGYFWYLFQIGFCANICSALLMEVFF